MAWLADGNAEQSGGDAGDCFCPAFGVFDRLQRALRSMPGWLGGRWRERRDTAGHRALTLGLMAVSAGEPIEARKQAARARRLLNAPQLTGLLSAQAAHLAGDHAAARRYFTALTDDQDTAFLGQIGLMRLAVDAGDSPAALAAGGKALDLKPNRRWRRGNYCNCMRISKIGQRR